MRYIKKGEAISLYFRLKLELYQTIFIKTLKSRPGKMDTYTLICKYSKTLANLK